MKYESQGRYRFVVIKGHPMADSRGRVLEHRYLMSEHLGRLLTKFEVVHHIDGDVGNNSIDNLKLVSESEHRHLHGYFKTFVCPACGAVFERAVRNARGTRTFCSRSCSVRFYHVERAKSKRP